MERKVDKQFRDKCALSYSGSGMSFNEGCTVIENTQH